MALNISYIYEILDRYSAPLNKIMRATKKVGKAFKKAGLAAKRMGQDMAAMGRRMATFVTLPILGLGAVMVKAASDAEETRSKFATIFRDMSERAEKTADTLASSFGLSGTAARQLLGDTADMLTGFGFTQDAALDLSNKVNELAVDLASFTNFSGGAEGASKALTKALLGERESVKSLGIAILEEDVKKKVALMRSQGMRFATKRQAKAYATLQIAIEQSKNAVGDYDRTQKSFANTVRRVRARLQDFNEEFGRILLPYANQLAVALETLLTKFKNLDERTKKIILIVAGLVAIVGPLLIFLGLLVFAFGTLATLSLPLIAAIAAVGGMFIYAAIESEEFRNVLKFVGIFIKNFVKRSMQGIKAFAATISWITDKIGGAIKVLSDLWNKMTAIFGKGEEKKITFGVNEKLIERVEKLKRQGKTSEEIRQIVSAEGLMNTRVAAEGVAVRRETINNNLNIQGAIEMTAKGNAEVVKQNIQLNGGANLAGAM